jgi:HK97 family phage prohead protease
MTMSDQHIRAAAIDDVAFGKREITLIAVPYNEEAAVPDWRPEAERESFMPGAFDGIESRTRNITLNRDHERARVIGAGVAFDTKSDRGLISTFKVSKTPLGDESLQLAADGVLRASISFAARSQDMAIKDGVMRFYRAFLGHVALTPEPAYEGASVLNVRTGEAIEVSPTPNLDLAAALLREIAAR